MATIIILTKACFVPPFIERGLSNLGGVFWVWNDGIGIYSDQMYSNYDNIYLNKIKIYSF